MDEFKALVAEIGGVDSFTTAQAAAVMKKFAEIIRRAGLDENSAADLLTGYKNVFNLEFYNLPDFNAGGYIFAPNHVSEFDGPLFGLLHPRMIVMAKKEWTDDPFLNAFLRRFFEFVGVDRGDMRSGAAGLARCIQHIKSVKNSAATVFVQQTIADINTNRPEDIASGVFSIHRKTGAAMVPVFCEQMSPERPARIVFGKPLATTAAECFGQDWLDAELRLQDSLTNPSARRPALNEKHSVPISKRGY